MISDNDVMTELTAPGGRESQRICRAAGQEQTAPTFIEDGHWRAVIAREELTNGEQDGHGSIADK